MTEFRSFLAPCDPLPRRLPEGSWNTLGVARLPAAGDWSATANALNESMRLRSGGDPYDWLFLAMAYHSLGDTAEARRWLDRSIGWIRTRAPHNLVLIPLREEALRLLGSGGPRVRDERSDEVSCTGWWPSDDVTVHESRVTIVHKGIEPGVTPGVRRSIRPKRPVAQSGGDALISAVHLSGRAKYPAHQADSERSAGIPRALPRLKVFPCRAVRRSLRRAKLLPAPPES